MKKIVVIGGGPAGMMAAIRAGQLKQKVILIEKNSSLGRKLLLTGKGRGNLTNTCDLDGFLDKFPKNGEFLRDAFKKFFNQELIEFFEKRELKLKVERQNRVFPESDNVSDVLKILERELKKNKVELMLSTSVREVFCRDQQVKGVILDDGRVIFADRVILATGGASFDFTGSCGDGFKIAQRLGHSIVALRPALVPLETEEDYPKRLQGLTLRNVRIKFISNKDKITSNIGELLFTHFGVSGPLVLDLSAKVVEWLREKRKVILGIDLKPAISLQMLEKRILKDFLTWPKRSLKKYLKELLPQKLISIFLDLLQISPSKKLNHITKKERQEIISLLKNFRLTIKRSRPLREAMITQGGVSIKEINPRTMESRLIKGLYFAGEIIDISSPFSGGFNLQMAFSTGYLAGESASFN